MAKNTPTKKEESLALFFEEIDDRFNSQAGLIDKIAPVDYGSYDTPDEKISDDDLDYYYRRYYGFGSNDR